MILKDLSALASQRRASRDFLRTQTKTPEGRAYVAGNNASLGSYLAIAGGNVSSWQGVTEVNPNSGRSALIKFNSRTLDTF